MAQHTHPGDPREDFNITLGCDDVCGSRGKWNVTHESIGFYSAFYLMHYTDVNEINYCLGGTITRQLFPRWLMPITEPNAEQKFNKKCTQFNGFERGKHRLVIPDIDEPHHELHNKIVTLWLNGKSNNKWQEEKDYSCLYQGIHCKLSWSIQQILSQTKEEMFMPVEKSCNVQIGCPTQTNGIECGLFVVMNCLHIFDGVAISPLIFT